MRKGYRYRVSSVPYMLRAVGITNFKWTDHVVDPDPVNPYLITVSFWIWIRIGTCTICKRFTYRTFRKKSIFYTKLMIYYLFTTYFVNGHKEAQLVSGSIIIWPPQIRIRYSGLQILGSKIFTDPQHWYWSKLVPYRTWPRTIMLGLMRRKASMTTLPLTDWMGSTTTATARSDSASKLCWVLMSTPNTQTHTVWNNY